MEQLKRKPEIMEATEKTSGLIRELQSRLRKGDNKAGELLRELEMQQKARIETVTEEAPQETVEDLEFQLHQHFERRPGQPAPTPIPAPVPGDIRDRVVSRVAERFLREWEGRAAGDISPLENDVVDRLVNQIFERLNSGWRRKE